MKFKLASLIGILVLVAVACSKRAAGPVSPESGLYSAQAGKKTATPTRTHTAVATATATRTTTPTFTATITPTPFATPTCPQILYIGDRGGFLDSILPNALTCMGYTVTTVYVPTYDSLCSQISGLGGLDQFCQVWDSRFVSKTSGTQSHTISPCEMLAYSNYLAQGGSLFLDGENPAYASRNDSLMLFVNTYVDQMGTVGNIQIDCGSDFSVQLSPNSSVLAAADNFGSNPVPVVDNSMDIHCTGNFQISTGQVGTGLPVLVNGTGSALSPLNDYAMSLAYNHGQIQPPNNAGKVFVYMDSISTSWASMGNSGCPTSHPLYALAANIAYFLNP